jgi:hypothetical protein
MGSYYSEGETKSPYINFLMELSYSLETEVSRESRYPAVDWGRRNRFGRKGWKTTPEKA